MRDEYARRCTVCRKRIMYGLGAWVHRNDIFNQTSDHKATQEKQP